MKLARSGAPIPESEDVDWVRALVDRNLHPSRAEKILLVLVVVGGLALLMYAWSEGWDPRAAWIFIPMLSMQLWLQRRNRATAKANGWTSDRRKDASSP